MPAPSWRTAQQHSDAIKLRRALGFVGMTLVVPGSAQLAAGNRRIGRIAVLTWATVWALVVVLGLGALVWRSGVLSLFTTATVLVVLQVLLVALGIGWALLFIDAWRLARPPELARRHRLGFAGLSGVLALTVVGSLVASASFVSSQRSLMTEVFAGGGETRAQAGRYNILLLGGDAGKGRTGLRPDSLTVASVDAETGRTVLISLPRNMEDVPFPKGSPMRKKFPKGFGCDDGTCMLNAVYTYASTRKGLYPDDVKDPGVQATKEAVEGATGLSINYYAMVDLKGFEALIDAVGGDSGRCEPAGSDWWRDEQDLRLHRQGRQPAAGRQACVVVRPVAVGVLRLRPDGSTEVRDERHAESTGPGDGAGQLRSDCCGWQGDREDRHPAEQDRHDGGARAHGQGEADL